MRREDYAIVYSSNTGNTKMLAEALHSALPEDTCKYFGTASEYKEDTEVIYVGFWTDKGTADEATITLLKSLNNKKVYLFGTAGFASAEYFERVLENVKSNLNSNNTIIGTFMCQGKMGMSVRQRYEQLKAEGADIPNIDEKIKNFDQALSHPDQNDLHNLVSEFVQ